MANFPHCLTADCTVEPPIAHWGTGDLELDKWHENNGAVSSISQRYPFTTGNHPVGAKFLSLRQLLVAF
jgi:triacylglycerol lipase